jgi:hypothetical protein
MIKYLTRTFEDGTQEPVSLCIGSKTYFYPEDELFIHLKDKIGEELLVKKIGYKNSETIFTIEKYDTVDEVPRLHLK